MSDGLQSAEPVLSTIDNSLAHLRLLRLAIGEGHIPDSKYDFKEIQHFLIDGLLHVILKFFLPAARRVKRQSAILGGDLNVQVHVWVMPIAAAGKIPHIAKRQWTPESYELHIIAPLREDLEGISW